MIARVVVSNGRIQAVRCMFDSIFLPSKTCTTIAEAPHCKDLLRDHKDPTY